ncbi:peptidoglycan recognition protein family protein [Streptomyces rimosus]|nr:N-acetylmuramoyl-L-alanine amidase [Streptomyces rimosus]
MTADQFLAALRAEGCQVREYRSWRTHHRNRRECARRDDPPHRLIRPSGLCGTVLRRPPRSAGPAVPQRGHRGRIDLRGGPRPRQSRGLGGPLVLQTVIAERSPLPLHRQATTDGNVRFYGLELVNRGTGTDPWPETQLDAAVRWAAALRRRHGWTQWLGAYHVIGGTGQPCLVLVCPVVGLAVLLPLPSGVGALIFG